MPTLMNPDDRQSICQRIENLHAESTALWGKMNVAQMLLHTQRPFEVAFNELNLPVSLFGRLAGGYFKRKYSGGKALPKNLPTLPQFRTHEADTVIDESRQGLLARVEQFGQVAATGKLAAKHPFFGRMSPDDWGSLLYSHTDHHLQQFGV